MLFIRFEYSGEDKNSLLSYGGYSSKGKGTVNYFRKFLKEYIVKGSIKNRNHLLEKGEVNIDGVITPYISLDSTSGVNTKPFDTKKEIWKKEIDKYIK